VAEAAEHAFGAKVRAYRTLRGWGQEDLASQIGKSVPTISRIEHGAQNLALAEICALAAALDVSICALFDDTDTIPLRPEAREIMVALMRVLHHLPLALLKQFLALAEGIATTLQGQSPAEREGGQGHG